ncbi:MAG: helix-turn-helix transcriptional regulator [Prevotella salivae]|jgi:Helix-turn-helix.|uniref:helix-turn-helix domain-containing protein n=1 Tax=Segatella salivae TaxID=228604 RepID=UPI001CAAA202|nr:helix-turn-helix transcriptional regulator [Segatella salivae]MBF1545300.1 helix-turn-helix transcriptional regulator [Segatella salivae]
MIFGQKIKELREEKGFVQRQLATVIEVDTPMYSKIERGKRKAKREHVKLIAKKLNVNEKELLTIWLADKVLDVVNNEKEIKNEVIKYVQNEIKKTVG